MLAEKRLNITEIAQACGFSGSSYYAETFRKIVGVSPGEYRKKH
jgi:AraC-like DNA-binding protein